MTYENVDTTNEYQNDIEVEGAGESGVVQILSRDKILAADDLTRELVHVPEWGGSVYVRTLTGSERDAYEESLTKERITRRGRRTERHRTIDLQNARARLCALTIVDLDGKRLFSDADVRELGQKSASALTRVAEVAQRLSGLTDDDVDELTGNSDDDQNDDSISD